MGDKSTVALSASHVFASTLKRFGYPDSLPSLLFSNFALINQWHNYLAGQV